MLVSPSPIVIPSATLKELESALSVSLPPPVFTNLAPSFEIAPDISWWALKLESPPTFIVFVPEVLRVSVPEKVFFQLY